MQPSINTKMPSDKPRSRPGKTRISSLHATIHKKSLSHTRKHLAKRTRSLKNSATKRFLFKFTAAALLFSLAALTILPKVALHGTQQGFMPGGSLVVGIMDPETNIKLNPLSLTTSSELGTANLIYSSLLRYDSSGQIQGDLARDFKLNADTKELIFQLKKDVFWHDGQKFGAPDVDFTINTIKNNPELNPELSKSLRTNDIKVSGHSDTEIKLSFSKNLSGLDDLFTKIRIAPKHIFENLNPEQIKSLNYSKLAIGTGPLQASSSLESRSLKSLGIKKDQPQEDSYQQISLNINDRFYGSKAQSNITLRIFHSYTDLEYATSHNLTDLSMLPSSGATNSYGSILKEVETSSSTFAFLNTSSSFLGQKDNRKALYSFTDLNLIASKAGANKVVSSPVPGLGDKDQAKELIGSTQEALAAISKTGWNLDSGQLKKDGTPLSLSIATDQEEQNINAAEALKDQWTRLGIDVKVQSYDSAQIQTEILPNRSYDVLVLAISTSKTSDPSIYWSSDQISKKGLNFSNYSSPKADADLSIAKSKLDSKERQERLLRFVQRWQEDVPAIGLFTKSSSIYYHPDNLYIDQLPKSSESYESLFFDLTNLKSAKSRIVAPRG